MSEAPDVIKELVDRFERNIESYKNSSYKEEQIKQEFINPFFKALGWDVDNEKGAAPQYRDVIFEDSIKVGGGTKAPDYCFTLSGRKMFFVEAKKPSVNLKDGIKPAYQLRRYAWSAKLPLSILTDFEEFVIYESRTLPKKNDRTSTGRILYLNYKEYVDRWDEIYNIFSREAVFKGAYDQYAESTTKKHGTQEVDDAFLKEIEGWRELFAKNIAIRNKELSVEELNYGVQQIIDRIIFLRMAEDRGIEKYGKLQTLLEGDKLYNSFTEMCKEADGKYNSGLFHFKKEKGRSTEPDELTPELKIDDGVFKTVIKNLYYPDSPYEFSVLPTEILGNVYEQFLGKVIRLTTSHMAKVEEKPEVKKAGGIYYTPQFIVDYIVKNTVGELCKGSTPPKVSKLRILDPACGSGSFLLGAYTYLLKWHSDYYNNLKDKKHLMYKGKNGEWNLTIQEKKRILQDNIYGVDIDPQAVEVTKLSLLLKVLEGENKDVLEAQQKLIEEKALPDLDDNIKCGNSLIGSEIYQDTKFKANTEDLKRINAFDWRKEFIEIMDNGGFDAIIGNPPYIRYHNLNKSEIEFYKSNYEFAKRQFDIYLLMMEKGLCLLKTNGFFGFIIPSLFLKSSQYEYHREYLLKSVDLLNIVEYGDGVFRGVEMPTCIINYKKSNSKSTFNFKRNYNELSIEKHLKQEIFLGIPNIPIDPNVSIIAPILDSTIKIGDKFNIARGLEFGKNKLKKSSNDKKDYQIISGNEIRAYRYKTPQYIDSNTYLEYKKDDSIFSPPKVMIREAGGYMMASYDPNGVLTLRSVFNLKNKDESISPKYLTCLLNSKLYSFIFCTMFKPVTETFPKIRIAQARLLPLYPANKITQKKFIEKTDQMLQLHEDFETARTPTNKKLIGRQIEITEDQIDKLVYELYSLSEEDIKIIEDSLNS